VTAEKVGKQLSTLVENSKEGDVLMLYFCGHGFRKEAKKYANNSGFEEMIICNNKTSLKS
jgi:hypothetical protein